MGLQWQLVAWFLYLEVALVFLLCMEFVSATRWKKIFSSRFVSMLKKHASASFYTLLLLLVLLFVDSVNKMLKYRQQYEEYKTAGRPGIGVGPDPGAMMFLAQRNLYITGFSLFLLLVVNRLMKLLSQLATVTAREEAALQQARSASTQSERLMDENADLRASSARSGSSKTSGSKAAAAASSETSEADVTKLRDQLREKSKELESAQASLEAIKAQAESTNREYDRLLKEHSQLQEQVGGQDKKTD
eukprot:scpid84087/ scgid10368/ B-cell receptor-associated protein 31; p28